MLDLKCRLPPSPFTVPTLTHVLRYKSLGPHWSATMLSLIEFAMIPIPLIFYRYGHKIREKSTLIRQMREDREKLDQKLKKAEEREERQRAREAAAALEKGTLEV